MVWARRQHVCRFVCLTAMPPQQPRPAPVLALESARATAGTILSNGDRIANAALAA
jgi:hypothetical protein